MRQSLSHAVCRGSCPTQHADGQAACVVFLPGRGLCATPPSLVFPSHFSFLFLSFFCSSLLSTLFSLLILSVFLIPSWPYQMTITTYLGSTMIFRVSWRSSGKSCFLLIPSAAAVLEDIYQVGRPARMSEPEKAASLEHLRSTSKRENTAQIEDGDDTPPEPKKARTELRFQSVV
jgi:hypothetical protein